MWQNAHRFGAILAMWKTHSGEFHRLWGHVLTWGGGRAVFAESLHEALVTSLRATLAPQRSAPTLQVMAASLLAVSALHAFVAE